MIGLEVGIVPELGDIHIYIYIIPSFFGGYNSFIPFYTKIHVEKC